MLKAALSCIALMLAVGGSADASVLISTAKTKNMNCSAGVCSPTATNAVLNRSDLGTMLRASDVKVTTGAGAITIAIMSPLTWANAHRLTLDAQHSVAIRSTVVVRGTGGLTITLEDGDAGVFNFYPGGSIAFWDTASSFVVNGNAYTLVNDVATLAADVASNPSGFYALAKDYDASGDGQYEDAVVMTPLTGTFEGLGHTISGLIIETFGGFQVGMFAEVDGTVRDLALSASLSCDPYINASASNGLLAGDNYGVLKNISVSGAIYCPLGGAVGGVVGANLASGQIAIATAAVSVAGTSVHYAGGVAGINAGMIRNASASGNISGTPAGGLVGNTSGQIQDSHATGRVSNTNANDVGGLAGDASGTILRCFATGDATGKQEVGGLVGYAGRLTIDSSFATGAATALQRAGGLVGGGTLTLINSYAHGAAAGTSAQAGYAGGLVGWFGSSGGTVSMSYSTGAPSGGRYAGGSVGYVTSSISMAQTYWDLDTSGVSNPASGVGNHANYPGVAGLTDVQMKSGLPAGFNPAIWGLNASINDGYPYLLANPPQN